MTAFPVSSNQSLPLESDVSLPRSVPNLARFVGAYYEGFLLALLLVWSPSNILAYGAPALMLGWFFIRTLSKAVLKNLMWLGLLWIAIILIHWPFVENYAWAAALMTGLTYSAFIPLLVIPTRFILSPQLLPRMQRWIAIVVFGEAVLGIVQAVYGFQQKGSFDGSTGDYVEGTIHPWLHAELAFSNPMFAANMTVLLLALIPALIIQRKYLIPIALGLVSLVLASVIHVLLFLAAATAIAGVLYAGIFLRRISSWLLVIVALFGILLTGNLLQGNLSTLNPFLRNTIEARTPRGVIIERVFTTVPEEYYLMPLFGLGPGQFSGRAALITTGQYFGQSGNRRALPYLPVQMSRPMRDYFWDLFEQARNTPYYGSTQLPAFSWLSFYTEMGGMACVLVLLFIVVLLLHIRSGARTYAQMIFGMSLSIGILFVCFLGIQENYWEVPQAIFPSLLILKAMYSHFIVMRRQPNTL